MVKISTLTGNSYLIHSSIRLEMHFADALPETMNIVCFDEYFNTIEISKNRQVVFDYNA